jgi:hypothetical protein
MGWRIGARGLQLDEPAPSCVNNGAKGEPRSTLALEAGWIGYARQTLLSHKGHFRVGKV